MDIQQLRQEIDEIDKELVDLFTRRMDLSAQVADYKKENNLPIYVPAREREILRSVGEQSGQELGHYTRTLYSMIFELSRSYQARRNNTATPLYRAVCDAMESTPRQFPQTAVVACQGVEGAYSQIACEKMFRNPYIRFYRGFEDVFSAIEAGECQYGILPIENSTAGSVNRVYDLMVRYNFSIVRTFRLKVDHNLLAKPGAALEDIREVYSHEQAISQCSGFLNTLTDVKIVAVENTAVASEMVARSGRNDVAAISSRSCAELYGLNCLKAAIQDAGNNHTRFICISKDLQVYPGSDKTSIMMTLPHRPGALYKVMARLYALGINVTKLESRPIPDRDFEFMFYFDLDSSIYSDEFLQLMCELESLCEEFKYLGSYSEVV